MVCHSSLSLLSIASAVLFAVLVQAQDQMRCDTNGLGNMCDIRGEIACPPCWSPSHNVFTCYKKADGKCPLGMWDRTADVAELRGTGSRVRPSQDNDHSGSSSSSGSSSTSNNNSSGRGNSSDSDDSDNDSSKRSCRPGNQSAICTQKCPICWQKRGSYYACYDKVNGRCGSGMKEVKI